MSADRRSMTLTPRTLLPWASSRGESTASPTRPGSAPIRPPATPLLAGMPTRLHHEPAPSYIPAAAITASVWRAVTGSSTASPVTGCTPPFASVAAITARSVTVTRTEHCRV
ncbi:hypothetical protein GCM10025875_32200 [Litorihabitans aurantiacus]|uniref:Uncharacterized protein n=1 Tax=Litorihabitans aurantiacus TaxID=1930061 RepID=A0AA37XHD1_9MICO|nr:hypothetical protein GCM10025875_32200 [Litorihabitans aurantiacus]